jgi:hypothetical protein
VTTPAGTGGAGGDASTYAGRDPRRPAFDNFNVSYLPGIHFPSFAAGPGAPLDGLGFVEWAGEFAWAASSAGVGVGRPASTYVGGQLGGPVVLFDPAAPRAAAVTLGAMAEFKSVVMAVTPDPGVPGGGGGPPRWVAGPHGHLANLPPGFTAVVRLAAPEAAPAGAPLSPPPPPFAGGVSPVMCRRPRRCEPDADARRLYARAPRPRLRMHRVRPCGCLRRHAVVAGVRRARGGVRGRRARDGLRAAAAAGRPAHRHRRRAGRRCPRRGAPL